MGLHGARWDPPRSPEEIAYAGQNRLGLYRISYEHRDEPGQRRVFGYADTWEEVKRAIAHLRTNQHAWYPKARVMTQ